MVETNKTSLDYLHQILWSRVYSYSLDIALEHQLFIYIEKSDGLTLGEISILLKMPLMSTRLLLQYFCGLDLIIKLNDRFMNSELSKEFLIDKDFTDGLESFANESLTSFKERLYKPKVQPWYNLREKSSSIENVDGISSEFFTSEYQHKWRISKGKELAANFDFENFNHLCDIGGASGGWCIGISKKFPHLKCTIFDLPEVCGFLSNSLSELRIDNTIDYLAGDMFEKPDYPSDIDIILLANVLHDWSRTDMLKILKNIYNSYTKITLLISELFINDDWNGPLTNTIQSILVLGPDGKSGWQPSYIEMEMLLVDVGFQDIKRKENLLICEKQF